MTTIQITARQFSMLVNLATIGSKECGTLDPEDPNKIFRGVKFVLNEIQNSNPELNIKNICDGMPPAF